MNLLPKAVATVASAALLTVVPVAAASAEAHPVHHAVHAHGHAGQHGKAHQHGKTDRLAGLRRGASHQVAAQLRAVQSLVTQAATLTITDAAGLQTALAADVTALQADQAAVSQATTAAQLHQLMRAAILGRQVARLQSGTVQEADAIETQAAALSVTVEQLQAQLAAVPGSDAALASLAQAATLLNTVAAQAPGIVQYVLAVSPTVDAAGFHTANSDVQQALASVQQALDLAGADVASAQAA